MHWDFSGDAKRLKFALKASHYICVHALNGCPVQLCNSLYRRVFRSHYSMEQGRNLMRMDLQRSGWPEKDRSLAEHEKTWGPGCCHVCVWVCQRRGSRRPLGGGWHNHWGSGATSQHSTLWLRLTFEESLPMDWMKPLPHQQGSNSGKASYKSPCPKIMRHRTGPTQNSRDTCRHRTPRLTFVGKRAVNLKQSQCIQSFRVLIGNLNFSSISEELANHHSFWRLIHQVRPHHDSARNI